MLKSFRGCGARRINFVQQPAHAVWPDRPVMIVVTFVAGNITDVMARSAAERLRDKFGKSFIIDNQVDAGGILATANAARAKPDGYTLFFGQVSLMTLSPMTAKVNYDFERDFTPVSILASTPFVITVNETFPARTLSEFLDEVKKKPGSYAMPRPAREPRLTRRRSSEGRRIADDSGALQAGRAGLWRSCGGSRANGVR